jgi:hypothetical protein
VSANTNFDEILTTTLAKHRPQLTDNVFKRNVISDRLLKAGNRRVVDGGVKIVEPLIHAENDTVTAYSQWDRLDLTPQAGISAAEYEWKQLAGSVAISGYEEAVNSGVEAIINLLEAKVMQLEKSLARSLNRQLWGDYTGLTEANAFLNLPAMIDSSGTIGNINPATSGNEFWVSVESDATSDVSFDESRWATAFYSASDGIEGPTFGVTTVELYQLYEEGLMDQIRYTVAGDGDSRFRNLNFKGIPMHFDVDATTGMTLLVNENNFNLVTHKDRWMKSLGFREAPDVDGRWSLVVSMGNLTCRARRGSAKIFAQEY